MFVRTLRVHKHRHKLTIGLLIFVLAGTAFAVWVASRPLSEMSLKELPTAGTNS